MDSTAKSISWPEEESIAVTSATNLTSEDIPTLTVTTIVGMTVVMVFAIAVVFLLGVLIDCRQQRIIAKKMGEAKRVKNLRRINTSPEDDSVNIANNMEESDLSVAPAEALRHIP